MTVTLAPERADPSGSTTRHSSAAADAAAHSATMTRSVFLSVNYRFLLENYEREKLIYHAQGQTPDQAILVTITGKLQR